MLLSYWITLLMPVLLLPVVSHALYGLAFEREKAQVAMDNAAIFFGEDDVRWLRSLDRGNRRLAALDKAHHPWHLCRLNPVEAEFCLPLDQAAELAIRALHTEVGASAQVAWRLAGGRARLELRRLKVVAEIKRAFALPIVSVRCPVCGLPVGWRVTILPKTEIYSRHQNSLRSVVQPSFDDTERGYSYALK